MRAVIPRLLPIILLILVCSCRNSSTKHSSLDFPVADSVPAGEAEQLSDEAIADIVQNMSSPVEIAALLQDRDVPFSAGYLAPDGNIDRLTTNFQKAVMLGIYGADLGYLNIYEKTGTSIDLLAAINQLADGLRVGQFFDFELLKRLSLNKTNLDSLLYLSVSSYNEIDKYLRESGRGSVSALLITGVWIEGQYLATQVVNKYPDNILRDRIGEQKIILNDLLMLLLPYKESSDEYSRLYNMMDQIRKAYREINITYKLGEPETLEQDGKLVMIQHEESIVEMTGEQLDAIAKISEEVRNNLISGL